MAFGIGLAGAMQLAKEVRAIHRSGSDLRQQVSGAPCALEIDMLTDNEAQPQSCFCRFVADDETIHAAANFLQLVLDQYFGQF